MKRRLKWPAELTVNNTFSQQRTMNHFFAVSRTIRNFRDHDKDLEKSNNQQKVVTRGGWDRKECKEKEEAEPSHTSLPLSTLPCSLSISIPMDSLLPVEKNSVPYNRQVPNNVKARFARLTKNSALEQHIRQKEKTRTRSGDRGYAYVVPRLVLSKKTKVRLLNSR